MHRHFYNLRISFTTMIQSQTTWNEGSLTLLIHRNLSPSPAFSGDSVPFYSINDKYKVCSFAWAVELSSSFVVKPKQSCGSYPFSPFFVIFGEFWGIFVSSDPFTYCYVGKYLGKCLVKFICFQSRILSLYNLWWNNVKIEKFLRWNDCTIEMKC